MRMRIKVVPVAGHLNADRDLGGRVTDLEYHGQIGSAAVSRLSQSYTLRRPGYHTQSGDLSCNRF